MREWKERPTREEKEKVKHARIVIKGYMRPDGMSYYVVIPKAIRELLALKGGEYFLMKARPEDGVIKLKLVEFSEEELA